MIYRVRLANMSKVDYTVFQSLMPSWSLSGILKTQKHLVYYLSFLRTCWPPALAVKETYIRNKTTFLISIGSKVILEGTHLSSEDTSTLRLYLYPDEPNRKITMPFLK